MDINQIIRFANENPICSIATIDGDMPRTRIFSMWYADETGFYFHTDAGKSVAKQIRTNPVAEVCFYAPAEPPDVGETMRVSGEVEIIEDLKVKERLLEERPFLSVMGVTGPDDPALFVFKIPHGEAFIWTMKDNRKESDIEKVIF